MFPFVPFQKKKIWHLKRFTSKTVNCVFCCVMPPKNATCFNRFSEFFRVPKKIQDQVGATRVGEKDMKNEVPKWMPKPFFGQLGEVNMYNKPHVIGVANVFTTS